MALSQVMLALRKKTGRTYDDVAYLIDLNPVTFFNYESGSRKMPITVFRKLCVLYNVDMKETLKEINDLTLKTLLGD